MRRIRTLLATSLVATLAIGVLTAPTAAATTKGKMAVVNGMVGTSVDICLGTNEVRSNLPYGGVYKKKLIGVKKLRFRKAAPGRCQGKVLAARTMNFPAGSDKSIVATKKTPKVLVFDNSDLGVQPAALDDGALAIRHAADLSYNTIGFEYRLWEHVGGGPLTPSAEIAPAAIGDFDKGDQFTSGLVPSALRFQTVALRTDGSTVIRESDIFEIKALRRFELYFVGTSAANSRMVRVTSALALAPTK